jgi:hypothetical protein
MAFNLNDYQTVQERVEIFRELYPNGRIINELITLDDRNVVVRCEIYLDSDAIHPVAVDYAQETIGSSNINKTSFLENCVTSATGRAISLLAGSMSPKGKRPSRTEMEKVKRAENSASEWDQPTDFIALAATTANLEDLRKLYAQAVQAKSDKATLDFILQRSEDLQQK